MMNIDPEGTSLIAFCVIFAIGAIVLLLAGLLASAVLLCITAGAIGMPNNAVREEALLPNGSVRSENGIFLADIVEAEPDVWEIGAPDLFRKQRLDMKGWAKQKTHIAKLIRLHLILRYYNENEQIAFSLPYGTQRYAKPTLFLRFTDLRGRQTLKRIVKNYKIKKGLGTRFALRMMLSPGKGHWREVNLSHYPIGLSDCCRIRLL